MSKVLFITNHSDHAVNSITAWLDKMGETYLRINAEDFLSTQRKLSLSLNSLSSESNFKLDALSINPSEFKSVCYRRPTLINTLSLQNFEYIEAQWKHIIWSLATTFTAYWVNHPLWGKYLLEHNKLYQLKCAAYTGLKVPDTIISNSSSEIINFSIAHGDKVACKPLRHTNIVDDQNRPVGIYTQMIRTEDFISHDDSIGIAPMIVQQYIEKNIELRVTIIGKHVFACEIHSQNSERTKHDWRRYDFDNVKHDVHHLPSLITSQICQLMQILRLNYGAMDLILSQDGEYYFLEVNPTGQYGWIEDLTGLPISETFADSLVNPEKNGIQMFPLTNGNIF